MKGRIDTLGSGLAMALTVVACSDVKQMLSVEDTTEMATSKTCILPTDIPVHLEGGTFLMGQDGVYAEEGPTRETTVGSFWIDPHEVTNRQFAEFAELTGYVTLAEKPVDPSAPGVLAEHIPAFMLKPGSAVFMPPPKPTRHFSDWWKYVPGAYWKKPYGPQGPDAQPDEPVVHLVWEDMVAYAKWKDGRIPTEAEWEYAATADSDKYAGQPPPDQANTWQGVFPVVNKAGDGFKGIAPVGCFKPNAFGLYDMIGNVWEVTADYFRPGRDPGDRDDPMGRGEIVADKPLNTEFASRVIKGGSYLCAPNYCQRYRYAARQGNDPGMGASNVGFRLAYDEMPER